MLLFNVDSAPAQTERCEKVYMREGSWQGVGVGSDSSTSEWMGSLYFWQQRQAGTRGHGVWCSALMGVTPQVGQLGLHCGCGLGWGWRVARFSFGWGFQSSGCGCFWAFGGPNARRGFFFFFGGGGGGPGGLQGQEGGDWPKLWVGEGEGVCSCGPTQTFAEQPFPKACKSRL